MVNKLEAYFNLLDEVVKKAEMSHVVDWQNSNYIYLSDLIFEKTNKTIHARTLKRIYDNRRAQQSNIPKPGTLDIFAAYCGFESWHQYDSKVRSTETDLEQFQITERDNDFSTKKGTKKPLKKYIIKLLTGIVIIIALISIGLNFFFISNTKNEVQVINVDSSQKLPLPELIVTPRSSYNDSCLVKVAFEIPPYYSYKGLFFMFDDKIYFNTKRKNYKTFMVKDRILHRARIVYQDTIIKSALFTLNDSTWTNDEKDNLKYFKNPFEGLNINDKETIAKASCNNEFLLSTNNLLLNLAFDSLHSDYNDELFTKLVFQLTFENNKMLITLTGKDMTKYTPMTEIGDGIFYDKQSELGQALTIPSAGKFNFRLESDFGNLRFIINDKVKHILKLDEEFGHLRRIKIQFVRFGEPPTKFTLSDLDEKLKYDLMNLEFEK